VAHHALDERVAEDEGFANQIALNHDLNLGALDPHTDSPEAEYSVDDDPSITVGTLARILGNPLHQDADTGGGITVKFGRVNAVLPYTLDKDGLGLQAIGGSDDDDQLTDRDADGSPERDLEYPELLYTSDNEANSSNSEFMDTD
jgi:hypothetical protein